MILRNPKSKASKRGLTRDAVRNHRSPVRLAASMVAAALASLAGGDARADGFDARIYRPSSETDGVGTIDGARAPDAGVIAPSIGSDLSVSPVTLAQGSQSSSVVDARWVVEPQLSFGVGASFGLYVRAPVVAGDWGRDANGAPLSSTGILPPSLGVLVPIVRNPLNDGRLALRAEVTAPLGSMDEFRSDGQVTARAALTYGGYWHHAYVLAAVAGQLAPVRGIGDAQIGRAVTGSFGMRVPVNAWLSTFGSIEARFDVDFPDQGSALIGVGLEAKSGRSIFRLLGAAGIRDVIGTPRAMIALSWSFDVNRPPAFMQPMPVEETPVPSTAGTSSEEPTAAHAQL